MAAKVFSVQMETLIRTNQLAMGPNNASSLSLTVKSSEPHVARVTIRLTITQIAYLITVKAKRQKNSICYIIHQGNTFLQPLSDKLSLQILLRLCNYTLCDDDLIGGDFICIVNNVFYMILLVTVLTLLLCNNFFVSVRFC